MTTIVLDKKLLDEKPERNPESGQITRINLNNSNNSKCFLRFFLRFSQPKNNCFIATESKPERPFAKTVTSNRLDSMRLAHCVICFGKMIHLQVRWLADSMINWMAEWLKSKCLQQKKVVRSQIVWIGKDAKSFQNF